MNPPDKDTRSLGSIGSDIEEVQNDPEVKYFCLLEKHCHHLHQVGSYQYICHRLKDKCRCDHRDEPDEDRLPSGVYKTRFNGRGELQGLLAQERLEGENLDNYLTAERDKDRVAAMEVAGLQRLQMPTRRTSARLKTKKALAPEVETVDLVEDMMEEDKVDGAPADDLSVDDPEVQRTLQDMERKFQEMEEKMRELMKEKGKTPPTKPGKRKTSFLSNPSGSRSDGEGQGDKSPRKWTNAGTGERFEREYWNNLAAQSYGTAGDPGSAWGKGSPKLKPRSTPEGGSGSAELLHAVRWSLYPEDKGIYPSEDFMRSVVSDMRNLEKVEFETIDQARAYVASQPLPEHWFLISEGREEGDPGIYEDLEAVKIKIQCDWAVYEWFPNLGDAVDFWRMRCPERGFPYIHWRQPPGNPPPPGAPPNPPPTGPEPPTGGNQGQGSGPYNHPSGPSTWGPGWNGGQSPARWGVPTPTEGTQWATPGRHMSGREWICEFLKTNPHAANVDFSHKPTYPRPKKPPGYPSRPLWGQPVNHHPNHQPVDVNQAPSAG